MQQAGFCDRRHACCAARGAIRSPLGGSARETEAARGRSAGGARAATRAMLPGMCVGPPASRFRCQQSSGWPARLAEGTLVSCRAAGMRALTAKRRVEFSVIPASRGPDRGAPHLKGAVWNEIPRRDAQSRARDLFAVHWHEGNASTASSSQANHAVNPRGQPQAINAFDRLSISPATSCSRRRRCAGPVALSASIVDAYNSCQKQVRRQIWRSWRP
ncbi:hypothetical protein BH09GEM1_BH09GEM1_06530 [soil metagenome]